MSVRLQEVLSQWSSTGKYFPVALERSLDDGAEYTNYNIPEFNVVWLMQIHPPCIKVVLYYSRTKQRLSPRFSFPLHTLLHDLLQPAVFTFHVLLFPFISFCPFIFFLCNPKHNTYLLTAYTVAFHRLEGYQGPFFAS